MRLGDLDVLKEKLQAHHDFFVNAWGGFSNLPPKDKARVDEITNCIAEVVNSPTIDAVPVVRCKDCKHCDGARDCIHPENIHHYYDWEGYDYESFHMVDPDHFCSYGERKDVEG